MNIQVINIQNDFQQNLNGNVGFLLYCFMNLCVKAEGAAFLSSEFVLGGQVVPIEDLGNVSIPDKSRLCVVPKEEEYIPLIIQGVLQEHPEPVRDVEMIGDGFDEIHVPIERKWASVQWSFELPVVRGMDGHRMVVGRRDGTIGVPVDRCVENRSALFRSVRLDIGPASCQPDSERGPCSEMYPIHLTTWFTEGPCASATSLESIARSTVYSYIEISTPYSKTHAGTLQA